MVAISARAAAAEPVASVKGDLMYGKERIYKKVEIIGVSSKGIEGATETALRKAQKSLDKISWFEVQDIRGHVGENGKVAEYQVVIKVSFELKE
jgi:flavin-binding protein dodecin